jgi:hypothetical protein
MDFEHEPEGVFTFRWKCPLCRYECLRYGKESLEQVKQDHLAGHDKQDRIKIVAEEMDTKGVPVVGGPKFSVDDKKYLKSIGIKVNYGE